MLNFFFYHHFFISSKALCPISYHSRTVNFPHTRSIFICIINLGKMTHRVMPVGLISRAPVSAGEMLALAPIGYNRSTRGSFHLATRLRTSPHRLTAKIFGTARVFVHSRTTSFRIRYQFSQPRTIMVEFRIACDPII